MIDVMQSDADTRRFWSKVEKSDECWLWTGAVNEWGYGYFRLHGKTRKAHRVAYSTFRGAIPDGLVLDHLCRVASCVNPDHLEPVRQRENTDRGLSSYAIRERCKSGRHDITSPAMWKTDADGTRTCRGCIRESGRRKVECPGCGKPLSLVYLRSGEHQCKNHLPKENDCG